jgi:hypothetical protein
MSTILEALKKSEQERKLNRLPTLSDMPVPQEPSKWPLIIGVLLCIVAMIILFIAVFWLGKGSVQPPVAVSAGTSITVSEANQAVPQVATTESTNDDVIVNVISYSEDSYQRFAMVNGKMVREGEFVRAGLRVEKIHLDSVVLNLRGKQITRKP